MQEAASKSEKIATERGGMAQEESEEEESRSVCVAAGGGSEQAERYGCRRGCKQGPGPAR